MVQVTRDSFQKKKVTRDLGSLSMQGFNAYKINLIEKGELTLCVPD